MMKVHNSSYKKLKFTIYWEFPCLSNKYLVFLFQIHNILGISLLIKQILSIFVSNSQYIGNMKQIGIQIRQRRKMLGINQQTLADLAQISINTITKIENGEININFQKLYAILEVLGLELSLKIKNKEGHL